MKLHDLILINVLVPCEKHGENRPGSWSKVALEAAEGCNCYSVPSLIFNIPHTEKSSLGFLSPPFCFSSCTPQFVIFFLWDVIFFLEGVCVCVSFEVFAEYLPFSFSSLHVLNLKPRSEVGRKLQQG